MCMIRRVGRLSCLVCCVLCIASAGATSVHAQGVGYTLEECLALYQHEGAATLPKECDAVLDSALEIFGHEDPTCRPYRPVPYCERRLLNGLKSACVRTLVPSGVEASLL